MKVILLPPSDTELEDAINYYNEQQLGLGERFYYEFLKTTELIMNFPEAWQKIGKNTRKIRVKKFPYMILYIVHNKEIFVTCIAHQHRNPEYYADKLY